MERLYRTELVRANILNEGTVYTLAPEAERDNYFKNWMLKKENIYSRWMKKMIEREKFCEALTIQAVIKLLTELRESFYTT